MTPSDVTNLYTPNDLLPIVRRLTEKYTSRESSSVTYERAQQFMGAAIYCIGHCTGGECFQNAPSIVFPGTSFLSAEDAYNQGYETVLTLVREALEKYNRLMCFFDHYGNRNYRDTVEKAMPAFFLHYDPRFAPTEHIITLDYPVLGLNMTFEGIDMIQQYLDAIYAEQCYLKQFPRETVVETLRHFHPLYEQEYFNLREIFDLHMQLT